MEGKQKTAGDVKPNVKSQSILRSHLQGLLNPRPKSELNLTPKNQHLPRSASTLSRGKTFRYNSGRTCVVISDFEATRKDELTLRKGTRVHVLSKDARISGDDGWWAGEVNERVGIFPSLCVTELVPLEISFDEVHPLGPLIGHGSFGNVHSASWHGEAVAVKMVVRGCVEAVRREAQLFWLLRHENIIALKGMCLQPPNICLVMELAQGGPLNIALQKYSLGLSVIVGWAEQIARGMSFLHELARVRVVHRDLKSSNVLILEPLDENLREKTLKIIDFGLARELHHTTHMSTAGTYAWMSPEVIKFQKFSKASDVWSFGVVLWELLTGRVPYEGFNFAAIIYGVGNNSLRLPIPQSCPPSFTTLLQDCWQIDAKLRPGFVEIVDRLAHIRDSAFVRTTTRENFRVIQGDWQDEVEARLSDLKLKEKELCKLEDELNKTQEQQRQHEAELERRERDLQSRELELVQREIQMLIQQQQQQMQMLMVGRRRGRFRKNKLHKIKNQRATQISQPIDFRHNFTVQEEKASPENVPPTSSPDHPLLPRLTVSICPSKNDKFRQTWTPSTISARNAASFHLPPHSQPRPQPRLFSSSTPNLQRISNNSKHLTSACSVDGGDGMTMKRKPSWQQLLTGPMSNLLVCVATGGHPLAPPFLAASTFYDDGASCDGASCDGIGEEDAGDEEGDVGDEEWNAADGARLERREHPDGRSDDSSSELDLHKLAKRALPIRPFEGASFT